MEHNQFISLQEHNPISRFDGALRNLQLTSLARLLASLRAAFSFSLFSCLEHTKQIDELHWSWSQQKPCTLVPLRKQSTIWKQTYHQSH